MAVRFTINTAFDVTPAVIAPGISSASPGLKAFEPWGLTIEEGEKCFHRVLDPANANNNYGGVNLDSFKFGTFPDFRDRASSIGYAVRQLDAQGLPINFNTLRLIAVRVQPRIPYLVSAAATILTSDGTNSADGETITIDSKTYTFKTTLTSVEGQVKIGTTALLTLTNLQRAILHTGTSGTDYYCAVIHPTVTAGTITTITSPSTEHYLPLTALTTGSAGNSIATLSTALHLKFPYYSLYSGGVSSNPPTAAPFNGSVIIKIENGLLPGSPAGSPLASNLALLSTAPGLHLFALESPWTPETNGSITIAFKGDSGTADLDTNAIVTLLLIGN